MPPEILYTVWSTFGTGESVEDLTREGAVARYGETTIAAMETTILIHPAKASCLCGAADALTVAFTPTVLPIPHISSVTALVTANRMT